MKRVSIVLLGILLCVLLAGCKCEHEWAEATCTEPKTCTKCKETEGEPLGHNWKAATCEEPETCMRCGEKRGTAKGHTWKEATCTEPKTCTACGKTEGEALGHEEGDWEVTETDMISATKVLKKYCVVCGEELKRKTQDIDTLHDAYKFQITPDEFAYRFSNELDDMYNCTLVAATGSVENKFACAVVSSDKKKKSAVLLFVGDGDSIDKSQGNEICFDGALGTISDEDNAAVILVALVKTCDPSLSTSEAKDLCLDLTDKKSVTRNGISYMFSVIDQGYQIVFALDD